MLNLTHGVMIKGATANLQFSQSFTFLQMECAFYLFLIATKALLSYHHCLQTCQPNELHLFHMLKAVLTHLQHCQIGQKSEIECLPFFSIATRVAHNQLLNTGVKESALSIQHNSLFSRFIIHPFSTKHGVAVAVILNTSAPSLSFTPFSFILHLLDVRVIPNTVTTVTSANLKPLIHLLSISIIQHTPTKRLII